MMACPWLNRISYSLCARGDDHPRTCMGNSRGRRAGSSSAIRGLGGGGDLQRGAAGPVQRRDRLERLGLQHPGHGHGGRPQLRDEPEVGVGQDRPQPPVEGGRALLGPGLRWLGGSRRTRSTSWRATPRATTSATWLDGVGDGGLSGRVRGAVGRQVHHLQQAALRAPPRGPPPELDGRSGVRV